MTALHSTARHGRYRSASAVRHGVLLALTLPFVVYGCSYVWREHTLHGLPSALAVSTIDGAVGLVLAAIDAPVRGLLYCLGLTVLTRLALGQRR